MNKIQFRTKKEMSDFLLTKGIDTTNWDDKKWNSINKSGAQPEIQELAHRMKEAIESSTPKLLYSQDWHLPFVDASEVYSLGQMCLEDCQHMTEQAQFEWLSDKTLEQRIKISVARCARVSYGLNERGWGDIEKDLTLYDMLASQYHMSPFEHIATPMSKPKEGKDFSLANGWELGITHMDREENYWSGNLKGWLQYRQVFEQSR